MIRRRQIWLNTDHFEALRQKALKDGLDNPEAALEAILADWLKANPAYQTYLTERSRLRDAADTEARRLAGL